MTSSLVYAKDLPQAAEWRKKAREGTVEVEREQQVRRWVSGNISRETFPEGQELSLKLKAFHVAHL